MVFLFLSLCVNENKEICTFNSCLNNNREIFVFFLLSVSWTIDCCLLLWIEGLMCHLICWTEYLFAGPKHKRLHLCSVMWVMQSRSTRLKAKSCCRDTFSNCRLFDLRKIRQFGLSGVKCHIRRPGCVCGWFAVPWVLVI